MKTIKTYIKFTLMLLLTQPSHAEIVPLTKPVILVGDSQEHERHGSFTYVAGKKVDEITKVAARSPQQDFYTKYALKYILDSHIPADAALAIHLGDFLDISCQSEWDRFENTIQDHLKNGTLAISLGNHDGFYIGNFSFENVKPQHLSMVGGSSWSDRCNKKPITKTALINKIVKGKTGDKSGAMQHCPLGMECGIYSSKDSPHITTYFQKTKTLEADSLNMKDSWKSYLVNVINIPAINSDISIDIKIITLDSSQSDTSVTSGFVTWLDSFLGTHNRDILYGRFLKEQQDLVKQLLEQPCDPSSIICLRILAAHHPFDDIQSGDKKWLLNLLSNTDTNATSPQVANLYLSAHTHTGYEKYHADATTKLRGFYEINVGSIIETEPHYRTLQLLFDKENNKLIVESKIHFLRDEINEQKQCPYKWQYIPEFDDSPGKTQYENKYSYLEQSRAELSQEISQAIYLGKILEITSQTPPTKTIGEKINKWAEESGIPAGIKNHCTHQDKKSGELVKSMQTKYWEETNFGTPYDLLSLLETMTSVTKSNSLNPNEQCFGKNNKSTLVAKGRDRFIGAAYLAYPEAALLSFTQDWLESLPPEYFTSMKDGAIDYRVCSAIRAATQTRESTPINSDLYLTLPVLPRLGTASSNDQKSQ